MPDIRRAGSAKQLGNVPTIMVVSAVSLACSKTGALP